MIPVFASTRRLPCDAIWRDSKYSPTRLRSALRNGPSSGKCIRMGPCAWFEAMVMGHLTTFGQRHLTESPSTLEPLLVHPRAPAVDLLLVAAVATRDPPRRRERHCEENDHPRV